MLEILKSLANEKLNEDEMDRRFGRSDNFVKGYKAGQVDLARKILREIQKNRLTPPISGV